MESSSVKSYVERNFSQMESDLKVFSKMRVFIFNSEHSGYQMESLKKAFFQIAKKKKNAKGQVPNIMEIVPSYLKKMTDFGPSFLDSYKI
jgi:hypothetical protein